MPTDASIPLSVQPFRLNSPFQALSQIMALRGSAQEQELRDAQIQNEREVARKNQEANAAQERGQRVYQTMDAADNLLTPPDPIWGTRTYDPAKVETVAKSYGADPTPFVQHYGELSKLRIGAQQDLANRLAEVGRNITDQDAQHQGIALAGWKGTIPDKLYQDLTKTLVETGDVSKALIGLSKTARSEAIKEGLDLSTTAKNTADAAKLTSEIGQQKPPTAEADNARYMGIQQAATLKRPVSAEDAAWAQAFEKQRGLTGAASAAAAAERQAATQGQQNAIQEKGQRFQEQQAGRSELTNKVEQPYLDAKEKASTLRTVIDAAKNGNMAAGNVQSLLATLGLVTMEGVKRINTTELNQVAGAGSLFEKLKGSVLGLKEGQPISPKIQGDLQQLSELLEKSAKQKYRQGFDAVTKRYRLEDEKPLDDESASGPVKILSITEVK